MPEDGRNALPRTIIRRIKLARVTLWWEHAWPALWPATGIAGGYTLTALLGILDSLPAPLAKGLLLLTVGGAATLVYRARHALTLPTWDEALKRLETMNGLAHQPLSAYQDEAAAGTGSDTLWAAHRVWLSKRMSSLRVRHPRPNLAEHDPMALRAALGLSLFVAFIIAGPDAGARLTRSLLPGNFTSEQQGRLDAWITPPTYTGVAPVFLTTTPDERPLQIPTASSLSAQVFGGSTPTITLNNEALEIDARTERNGRAYEARTELTDLTGTTALNIRQEGRTLGEWHFELIPDTLPQVMLLDEIGISTRNSMKFVYALKDDYGVTALKATLALDPIFVHEEAKIFQLGEEPPVRKGFSPLIDGFVAETIETEIDLPLPGVRVTDATETAYKDLLAHPWAGLPVTIQLIATDDAKQEGASRTVTLSLPARRFTKPLAAAIVEQRQRLALSPLNRGSVAGFLNAFTFDEEIFEHDSSIYLGLRAAYWRLVKARRPGDLDGLSTLLWDIALNIEDGDLSVAERDLRAARDALTEALAEGASADEIERLMQELKQALNEYLTQLENRATAGAPPTPQMPGDGELVDRADLESLLEQIGDLARTGARDQAQDLLSALDDILENLNTGEEQQQSLTPGEQELSDAIDRMAEMIEQQRKLMDDTFQQGQQSRQQGQGATAGAEDETQNHDGSGQAAGEAGENQTASDLEGLRERQNTLRKQLEELMGELGEKGQPTPGPLDQADQAMKRAEDRLERGRPGSATGAQGQAIDQLRQGAQALADAMMESMAARGEQSASREGGEETDPLGRPLTPSGNPNADRMEMPDENDLQQARQILEELRKRAAELGRPQSELDYLERLLRRF